jgi:hypothetical protein
MMRTTPRHWQVGLFAATLLVSGCEFFDNDDQSGDDETGTGDDEGGDPQPTRGFRVFPKYLLHDVAAIVTIQGASGAFEACELDAVEGGYVCDADALDHNTVATIDLRRDGFETALRHPLIPFSHILPLEVHLAVEGGPPGEWSPCVGLGEFATCADLCASVEAVCAATSCSTDDPEWPLATHQTFAASECAEEPLDSLASSCDAALPVAGAAASLRCCCVG